MYILIYMITKSNAENNAINRRLDAIIGVIMNLTTIQEETMKEKIARLIQLEFDNNEIANILGTTAGSVAKERSLLKKGSKNE